ncbi:MAG: hypothetical protein U0625_00285 [Phycisphaerales bacterium]
MSDAHREDSVVTTLPCPTCGYELAQTQGSRCPECGGVFDRAALTQRDPSRVSGAVLVVMLCFMFGTLPLAGLAFLLGGAFDAGWMICIVVPYSAMLAAAGKGGTAVGFILAALQGPVYGVILGLSWPTRMRRRVWVALGTAHALAAAFAAIVVLLAA